MSDMVQDSYMNVSAGDFGRYAEKENSAEKSDDKFFRGIKIFITILVHAHADVRVRSTFDMRIQRIGSIPYERNHGARDHPIPFRTR